MADLIPGKRYRVTVEGVVDRNRRLRTDGGGFVSPNGLRDAKSVEEIVPPAPKWRPGDVVVVRYSLGGTPYTYVRGMRGWPGEAARAKTDAEISALYAEGKAKPVLQAGGVAFDPARLPQRPSFADLDLMVRYGGAQRPGRFR